VLSTINVRERPTIGADAWPVLTGIVEYVLQNQDGGCQDMLKRRLVISATSEQNTEARYTFITWMEISTITI